MENITVVGIGRMGLCFALALENAGFNVLGLDIVEDYVENLNSKEFDSPEPIVNEYLRKSDNFKATTSLEDAISYSDMIFVMLRTGNLSNGKYDHCYVEKFLEDLEKIGKQSSSKDIVICSNVSPGYCDEIQRRFRGFGYLFSFNPEWIAQGRIIHDFENPDIVVIGEANPDSGDRIERVHKTMCNSDPKICKMDRISAELVKIGLNSFLTVKVAYANLLGDMAIQSGVDPAPILDAIGSDSRICDKYLKYGFGYGGPCFPRDTQAFSYYGKHVGLDPNIIESVMKANDNHTDFQVERFMKVHDKSRQLVINSVTYKKGTIILEESQQLKVAVKLAESGYKVKINESSAVIEQVKDIYGDMFEYCERGNGKD